LFIRSLIICLSLAFAASAQTPGRQVEPSQSERELAGQPIDLGSGTSDSGTLETPKAPSAWRSLGSLVFVLAIFGGGVWALRKWGLKRLPGSGGNRMKIEETLALGERRYVSILKVDDERFLIASYPQGIGLLGRLDGSAEPGFGAELDQQMDIQTPIPVKEMEARLMGEQQ
jgi:flagellar biogenesis protein FliO